MGEVEYKSFEELEKEIEEWRANRSFIAKWFDKNFPHGIGDYPTIHALTHPWHGREYLEVGMTKLYGVSTGIWEK
jgi:hypothetical protein